MKGYMGDMTQISSQYFIDVDNMCIHHFQPHIKLLLRVKSPNANHLIMLTSCVWPISTS